MFDSAGSQCRVTFNGPPSLVQQAKNRATSVAAQIRSLQAPMVKSRYILVTEYLTDPRVLSEPPAVAGGSSFTERATLRKLQPAATAGGTDKACYLRRANERRHSFITTQSAK